MSVEFERLDLGEQYVDPQSGRFLLSFIVYWQKLLEALEGALADIVTAQADIVAVNEAQSEAIAAIEAAQAAADAANAAAATAQTAATNAQAAADDANDAIVTVNTTLADHETRIQALEP